MKRGTKGVWGEQFNWVETSVGANVRKFRRERGMTQVQLAEAVGLEVKTLQRIEAGFGNVTARVFFVLTNTLQVDPKAMFEAAEVPPRKRGRPRKDGLIHKPSISANLSAPVREAQ